jgi:uncharacterized Fe-S cluster-containing MiaB family protein
MINMAREIPELKFLEEKCIKMRDSINAYISVVTKEDNLTDKNRDDIFKRLTKMGGIWNEKEMTAAGCCWFASGALTEQLNKIENSKRLQFRAKKTREFIDEFESIAWTIDAMYGNEDAVSESIELLETYNLYMG